MANTSSKLEVMDPEQVLSETDRQQVKDLEVQFPSIVAAVRELQASFVQSADRYFNLCRELRASKLNGREAQLLLVGQGMPKTRISEIRRVYEVDDVAWAAYEKRAISFKGVLQAARSGQIASPNERTVRADFPATWTKNFGRLLSSRPRGILTGRYKWEMEVIPDPAKPEKRVLIKLSGEVENTLASTKTKKKKGKATPKGAKTT